MRSVFFGGLVAALVAVMGASGALASAAQGAWVLLGTRSVSLKTEQDTIPVSAALGLFDHLYVKVRGDGINIVDMHVTYSNGGSDDIPIRAFIPAGGNSRVIDLRGGNRLINSIRLTYQKRLLGGVAIVEVYGQR